MSTALPPFPVRHSRLVLMPAILNLCFAFLLWRRGIAAAGVISASVVPLAVLVCLYWILRDGHFYDPTREEGDPDRLISYDTKPKHYWTIVILCGVVYSGMTFLTGIAAIGEAGR